VNSRTIIELLITEVQGLRNATSLLREENERLRKDAEWMNGNIVDLRKSLARYRDREMTMGWNQE